MKKNKENILKEDPVADLKKDPIMRDFIVFENGEEYDKRIGKAWKRGYLLYEPSGTGKIVDMANLMSHSSYYIEQSSIRNNGELKWMLLAIQDAFSYSDGSYTTWTQTA
ncbi:AAA domain-containing protein [Raphanus sativus]|nr:AAA domain-containing protein [Raphanus sativus]